MHILCKQKLLFWMRCDLIVWQHYYIHYIAKSIGTPSNEMFDYFSNFHEYKS